MKEADVDPDLTASVESIDGGRSEASVTVKLDGVDGRGDGPAPVAPPLLLRLLVSERFPFCELEHVISFLAPVAVSSELGFEGVV